MLVLLVLVAVGVGFAVLLVFVLVQYPGLLLPVCGLGLRGGCLGA